MRLGPLFLVASVQLALLFLGLSSVVPLGGVLLAPAVLMASVTDFESLADSLGKKGVDARAPALITGKSGVKHEFDLAVRKGAAAVRVVVDSELSVREVDEMKVLKFYVKVFDVGPERAILCVSPRLSKRAAALAKEYGIEVLEDDVPKKLVGMAAGAIGDADGSNGSRKQA